MFIQLQLKSYNLAVYLLRNWYITSTVFIYLLKYWNHGLRSTEFGVISMLHVDKSLITYKRKELQAYTV